jgi:hypothetical protein
MRVANDPNAQVFSSWLLDIGHGRERTTDETIHLPPGIVAPDLETFIGQVYPGIASQKQFFSEVQKLMEVREIPKKSIKVPNTSTKTPKSGGGGPKHQTR